MDTVALVEGSRRGYRGGKGRGIVGTYMSGPGRQNRAIEGIR